MSNDIAFKFLSLFPHQKYTLCYFSSKGMRSFPCVKDKLEAGLKFLQKENKDSEIYFMVNEGNGELNASKTACHSTKNVTQLSSIFLDLEVNTKEDPLPALRNFCEDSFCLPSIIIESSPQRYHVYWLLEAQELTKESITKWKQIQALLHEKLSSDRTMTDISQILRIPGFKNIKKDWPVNILEMGKDVFSLNTLYEALQSKFPDITKYKAHQPLHPITENYIVEEGNRHEEMLKRGRKVAGMGLDDEEVKCFLDGFILNHLKDSKPFLNGSRRPEIDRMLKDIKGYVEEERRLTNQIKVTKAIDKANKKKSPFELDPEFFYQAPGIVGELTRHFVDTSKNPIPAHAFAAASSVVGFCKARYIQSEDQLPPLNYFLCLAPAGSGKTTIQHMVKNVLKQLGISHLVEDGIASGQGLVQFLANSHGLGMILHDEVRSLFQIIQSKSAASHELMIPIELTKLYTAYKSSYTPPTTKTHKGTRIVIDCPKLAFLGYGQHTLIEEKLFTKGNIQAGLLPRFIILTVNSFSFNNDAIDKPLPKALFGQLNDFVVASMLKLEEKIKDANLPVDAKPKVKTVLLDKEATAIFNRFKAETIQLQVKEANAKSGLEAIYSRGAEQSIRLSLANELNGIIELKEMQHSIDLASAQMGHFKELFTETADQTDFARQQKRLLDKIVDTMDRTKDAMSKRDLQRSTQNWFKPGEFKLVCQSLVEMGTIVESIKDKKVLIHLGEMEAI